MTNTNQVSGNQQASGGQQPSGGQTTRGKVVRMTTLALLTALIILLGFTPVGLIPLGFINVTTLCIPVLIGTLYLGWKEGLVLGLSFGAVSLISMITKPQNNMLASNLMTHAPVLAVIMTFIPRLCIPCTAWFIHRHLSKKTEEKAEKSAAVIFGGLLTALIGLALVIVLYLSGALPVPKPDQTVSYVWSRNNVLLLMGCIVFIAVLCGVASAAFVNSKGFRNLIAKHSAAAVASVCGSLTNTILYLGMMLLFYIMSGLDTAGVLALIGGTALIAGLSEATVAAVLVPPILTAVQKIRR